jgi:hypothetical protein
MHSKDFDVQGVDDVKPSLPEEDIWDVSTSTASTQQMNKVFENDFMTVSLLQKGRPGSSSASSCTSSSEEDERAAMKS